LGRPFSDAPRFIPTIPEFPPVDRAYDFD
jgi:choline dehydrogenase